MSNKTLIWSDEFDYEGPPDPAKWSLITGGGGFGNNELQFYRPDNALVTGGQLVITQKLEDCEHRHYTSARMHSHGKFSFLYGYVEARMRLPVGKGTWPAFWMLSDTIRQGVKWPDCGEIDIMEHVGVTQDIVHFSTHSETQNHKIGTQFTRTVNIPGVSEEFHTYFCDWTPDAVALGADGVVHARLTKEEATSWPFDTPHFILLNCAVGGFFGGEPDDTIFPQTMEVDYVRVYQDR